MASSKSSSPARTAPRLYLATPALDDTAALASSLPPLLAEFDIAALLLRLANADERTLTSRIKTLAGPVQAADTALLVDRHANLVARAGADGAHVDGLQEMEEASSLKPQRILGVGQLHTRHDAMLAGENGADYLLFGEPDSRGERPSPDAIFERLQWWAELFEPPCVGYAATLEEATLFAGSGADFIMVADFIWNDARGPKAALTDAQAAIAERFKQAFGATQAAQT
jgi:thiamine-phosphate pyrophosphorylase